MCAAEADSECGCPIGVKNGHVNSLELQKLLQRDRCLAYHAELAVLLGMQKDFQLGLQQGLEGLLLHKIPHALALLHQAACKRVAA